MNKLNLIVFLTLLPIVSLAQDFKVNIGNPQKVPAASTTIDAGIIDNYLYSIDKNSKKGLVNLSIYDANNLNLISVESIKQNSCGKNTNCIDKHFNFERVLYMKNELILLVSTYNKSDKEEQLFAQRINKDGVFQGDLVLIDKIEAKNKKKASFSTWYSDDYTKFMVLGNLDEGKEADETFNFKVYDENLKNILNSSVKLPYKDENVSIRDYYVSNNGQVLLLVNVSLEKDQKDKTQDDHFYEMLVLNNEGNIHKYKVQLPNKTIETIGVRLDDVSGRILCSGLYSNIKTTARKAADIDGVFFLNIDLENMKVVQEGFKPLSEELISSVEDKKNKDKNKEKDNGISNSFVITDIINRENGGIVVLSEMRRTYKITTRTTDSNGVITYHTTYYYERGMVLASYINEEGEITQYTVVLKNQQTKNDNARFSSYQLIEKDNRIILVFNDHENNFSADIKKLRDVKKMVNVNKADLVAVELLPNGKYTKQRIFNNKERRIIVSPKGGKRISDGEYVLPYEAVNNNPLSKLNWMLYSPKQKKGVVKISAE